MHDMVNLMSDGHVEFSLYTSIDNVLQRYLTSDWIYAYFYWQWISPVIKFVYQPDPLIIFLQVGYMLLQSYIDPFPDI